MINSLDLTDNQSILEPSAGDGVFIDKIIDQEKKNVTIDVFEIDPAAVGTLNDKYQQNPLVNIYQKDTLIDETLTLHANNGGMYDRVIANPPYGGWQNHKRRKKLKKLYSNFYTKETYTLFLHRAIDVTKFGGIVVFIIPDTFLNLHRHKKLRKLLLSITKIQEIKLFPSSFFPEVDFGYSGLCTITLEKCASKKECLDNQIKVYQDFKSVKGLLNPSESNQTIFSQKSIYHNIDHAFFMSKDVQITNLINHHDVKLDDLADCVTGFYSGNNRRFLRVKSRSIRRSKGYDLANANEIISTPYLEDSILEGSASKKHLVPIVKGGNKYFHKKTEWFADWSKEAISHYKKSKKARFQNSDYYFRSWGLAVPMVKSSNISASTLNRRLFDQSIVGVFPHDKQYFFYLLALFNSPTFYELIELINPTANNSANYLKKLPIIIPGDNILELINSLTRDIVAKLRSDNQYLEEKHSRINKLINNLYS